MKASEREKGGGEGRWMGIQTVGRKIYEFEGDMKAREGCRTILGKGEEEKGGA